VNKEIIVIIGGPGTGKSTIIDGLLEKGFNWQDNIQRTIGKETVKPQNVPDSRDETGD
jgi:predicted ATPase